jgi:GMP synthase (glutamine-hydrolysing)
MSNSDKHVQAEIAVIDFGSQYTQLIARRLRDIGAFSQIYTCYNYQEVLNRPEIRGVILSGGPSSVNDENAPDIGAEIFDMDVPVLGVCYGMQLMCQKLGGQARVRTGGHGTDGRIGFLPGRADIVRRLDEPW